MNRLLLLLYVCILLHSCSESTTTDNPNVGLTYSTISGATILTSKAQQEFIDKLTAARKEIESNAQAIVNTGELELLLYKARAANQQSINLFNTVSEADTSIRLKTLAIEYAHHLDGLYKNEFPQVIKILKGNAPDRSTQFYSLLSEKTTQVQAAYQSLKRADSLYREKYHLVILK